MKMPKQIMRYCPTCKKQTEHKVLQVKGGGGKRNVLNLGTRRFERKREGYGSFPRKKPENCKRWGVKLTKKVDLRYQCKDCKKMTIRKRGFRIKKLEMEAAK
jgi:large subunit ribosomal protein L44e